MARAGLAKRIKQEATSARTPLYRWLFENHDEIAQVVQIRGSWGALRNAAIDAGIKVSIRTGGGNVVVADPSVAALRSSWQRVEADKAKMSTIATASPKRTKAIREKRLNTPPNASITAPTTAAPKPENDAMERIRAELRSRTSELPDPPNRT